MKPTERFSRRVDNYVRYRPGYPAEIISQLQKDCGFTRNSIVADVGSGTGFLAKLFLANGNRVFGIEPNREMREAGEQLLRAFPNFVSIAATAEATTLSDASVDFATAGQAFHWFDRSRCRDEFKRILKPAGWVVLAWNDRRTDTTPFLVEYEQLLQTYGTDYSKVDHKQVDAKAFADFFEAAPIRKSFPTFQTFDLHSLKGRLLSSSYVPEAGEPGYPEMLDSLEQLFKKHALNREVTFEYDTIVYCGQLEK